MWTTGVSSNYMFLFVGYTINVIVSHGRRKEDITVQYLVYLMQ